MIKGFYSALHDIINCETDTQCDRSFDYIQHNAFEEAYDPVAQVYFLNCVRYTWPRVEVVGRMVGASL